MHFSLTAYAFCSEIKDSRRKGWHLTVSIKIWIIEIESGNFFLECSAIGIDCLAEGRDWRKTTIAEFRLLSIGGCETTVE